MNDLFLLSKKQFNRIKPYFPLSHGIIYVIKNGLRWKDAPVGYDADWFRAALKAKGITPCIPGKKNRKIPIEYDKNIYRQRHKIENMFAKLKDSRRIATRYDRCAHIFFSAICIAATVIFYLN